MYEQGFKAQPHWTIIGGELHTRNGMREKIPRLARISLMAQQVFEALSVSTEHESRASTRKPLDTVRLLRGGFA